MRGKLTPQQSVADRHQPRGPSPLHLSGAFREANVGILGTKAQRDPANRDATRELTSITQPSIVQAPAGAVYNQPNQRGFIGALFRQPPKAGPTDADTRPDRGSLRPVGDGLPPNPGRPEFGAQGTDRDGA